MRHRGLFWLMAGAVLLTIVGASVWLALGEEAALQVLPAGSDKLRLQSLTASQAHLNYRLPRGQTMSTLAAHLTSSGWTIYDQGARVLWPEVMDDSRASASFWRVQWFGALRQSLTIRRDMSDPRVYWVDVYQCIRVVLLPACA